MEGLIVESGPQQGTIAEIRDETVLIGRGDACHISLDDDQVSREHAAVAKRGRRVVLRDLQSRNGTQMDGHFVKERRLKPGEAFSVGQTQIRYTDQITVEDRTLFAAADLGDGGGRPRPAQPVKVVYDNHETSKLTYVCLVCCLMGINAVFAAAALASGVVSIAHIKRRGDLGGMRLAWAVSAIALALCVFHAHRLLWVPAADYWRRVEAKHQCRRNLRTIHGAILRYTIDHANRFPRDLSELVPGYLNDPSCLACPLAVQPALLGDGTPASYSYFGDGVSQTDSGAVLLADHRSQNHAGEGRLTLFSDGRIQFVAEEDFHHLVGSARARAVPATSRSEQPTKEPTPTDE